jgi:uncharacterized protein YceH (UPF0502 family)
MSDMTALLSPIEARIVGCLIEKEITLPDYYPLTLNSLTAACNQTTNRDPIMALDESSVLRTTEALKTRGWVFQVTVVGGRVNKFRHNIRTKFVGLEKPTICLLSVLLLRGEQTLGELRQRTERLCSFPDLESVEAELMKLVTYSEGPIVACLPAGPGRRVAQWAQLLTGEPGSFAPAQEIIHAAAMTVTAPTNVEDQAWKQRMEMEIETLKAELSQLKVKLGLED